MKTARRAAAVREPWGSIGGLVLRPPAVRGRQLAITLMPDAGNRWHVLAVEGAADATAAMILGDHFHQSLGSHLLRRAMRLAEEYARTWQPVDERCECSDIDPCGPPSEPQETEH